MDFITFFDKFYGWEIVSKKFWISFRIEPVISSSSRVVFALFGQNNRSVVFGVVTASTRGKSVSNCC